MTERPAYTLILGGTRGLGAEIAKQCRERGERLIVTGRSAEDTIDPLSAVRRGEDISVRTDLARSRPTADGPGYPHLQRVLEDVTFLADLTAFYWTSGAILRSPFAEMDERSMTELVDANFTNALRVARMVWQHMRSHGRDSRFVVIASTTGKTEKPRADEAVYAATKAAQVSFARALGHGATAQDPRVALFCPGGMRSDFWKPGEIDPDLYRTFLDQRKVASKILQELDAQTAPFLDRDIPRGSL